MYKRPMVSKRVLFIYHAQEVWAMNFEGYPSNENRDRDERVLYLPRKVLLFSVFVKPNYVVC